MEAIKLLESGEPIECVKFANRETVDRLIADLKDEVMSLLEQELRSRPDLYVQDSEGTWATIDSRTQQISNKPVLYDYRRTNSPVVGRIFKATAARVY